MWQVLETLNILHLILSEVIPTPCQDFDCMCVFGRVQVGGRECVGGRVRAFFTLLRVTAHLMSISLQIRLSTQYQLSAAHLLLPTKK